MYLPGYTYLGAQVGTYGVAGQYLELLLYSEWYNFVYLGFQSRGRHQTTAFWIGIRSGHWQYRQGKVYGTLVCIPQVGALCTGCKFATRKFDFYKYLQSFTNLAFVCHSFRGTERPEKNLPIFMARKFATRKFDFYKYLQSFTNLAFFSNSADDSELLQTSTSCTFWISSGR